MKACSGQNHDNKIALQVNFNPTAANNYDGPVEYFCHQQTIPFSAC